MDSLTVVERFLVSVGTTADDCRNLIAVTESVFANFVRHIRAAVLDNLAALDNHIQFDTIEERFIRYVSELDERQRGGTDVACQRTGAPAETQQRLARIESVLVHLEVRG